MKSFMRFGVCLMLTYMLIPHSIHASETQLLENYGNIPLSFTENTGQYDPQVKFTTNGSGCTMYFTASGTTYLLSRETEESLAQRAQQRSVVYVGDLTDDLRADREYDYFAIKLNFLNAKPDPSVTGDDLHPGKSNYFIGSDSSQWRTDVANYGKVRLNDLYDGIDLVYYGNRKRVKYDFVVLPGIDPSQIQLDYELGQNSEKSSLYINDKGELVVSTPLGDVIERQPYAYQIIDGHEVEITVEYMLIGDNRFSFSVGDYDSGYELVIDPELVYSTFIGGSGTDSGSDICVDSAGCVYVAGYTTSSNYPTTSGAYNESIVGSGDISVCKLNAAGNGLIYSTIIGGSDRDNASSMALSTDGCVYIAGYISSSDYPVTSGSYDESHNGALDTFVSKLNATGNGLLYSTYLGGSSDDRVYDTSLDSNGNIYVSGRTSSSEYPVTSGAYDESYNGGEDAFVTKLNATGSDLVYSTFLGGSGYESGQGFTIDDTGCAYVTGRTESSDYPVTSGAYDESFNGGVGGDMFISKLNATASSLIYSTFIGGVSSDECGNSIDVDSAGCAYICGVTGSSDYPVTLGAYDESFNGVVDAIVTKLNAAGNGLIYSTFIGGGSDDYGYGITVDDAGNAYMMGHGNSSDIPVTADAYDNSFSGRAATFFCRLNVTGSDLEYSTYLSGSGQDIAGGLALDSSSSVYVTGYTHSSDFPIKSGAYDETHNGGSDAFVAKFSFASPTPTVTLTAPNGGESYEASTSQNITWSATSVTNVKLEYSTNNGTDWTEIVASTAASAGSYAWTVPIRPSVNCLVRVSDASDAGVTDTSDSTFTITESTGQTIVFHSVRDGNEQIYVMNPDGSNQTRITYTSSRELYPSWSPDGSKILFGSYRDGCDIFVMDADGSNQTRLTEGNSYADLHAKWSPHGSKIVYESWRDGDYEIKVMNNDGSNKVALTNNSNPDNGAHWSPDGSKIVYCSGIDGNYATYEIYVIDSDGSNQIKLTNNSSGDSGPAWSPDGTKIAFRSNRDGNDEVYVMNSDGTNQTRLTNNTASEYHQFWSPDGTKISFLSNRDGNNEIYIMNSDGSNQTRLTNNSVRDEYPSWARPVYVAPATVTLTAPNGAESWEASSSQNITWTSSGVTNVKLDYSTNNGTDWTEIVASTAASAGSYAWTMPIRPSVNCKVRVSDASDASVTDTSDAAFGITESTGETVLFGSKRDDSTYGEIYVMNPDGSNVTRLSYENFTETWPTWSPDGTKILFTTNRDVGNIPNAPHEIYTMDADGSNWTRISYTSYGDYKPSFSPDGSKIVYTAYEGNGEIYTCNADGSNIVNITNHASTDEGAIWTPDGRIVFISQRDRVDDLYIMDADGSNVSRITNQSSRIFPCTMIDTSTLIYGNHPTHTGLYSINIDGTNTVNLTNTSASESYVTMSPDGSKIIFDSNRDGDPELYMMNADGSNVTRITNSPGTDHYPSWRRPTYMAPSTPTVVTLTAPNGGESWEASTSQNITWSASNVTNVKLEYSTNNGTDWTEIVASTAASAGSYAWTVPIRPSVNCIVRVSDASDASVTDTSDAAFTITESTGETILFMSENDQEIYVMNPDGTNQTQLTNNSTHDQSPHWSPDGTKIVFSSYRDGDAGDIYKMDADGSNQTRLTSYQQGTTEPSWSPDNSKIAFRSGKDGNYEIYIMNTDGSNVTRLTNNSTSEGRPHWLPDGSKIVFTSNRDGNSEIYVMNSDGSNQTRITNNSSNDGAPVWSPDGTKIGFYSNRDGNEEIYSMNADGSNQTRLTSDSSADYYFTWSPDGSKIVFMSDRSGNQELYVMNADGSSQIRLTNNSVTDIDPSWARPIYQEMAQPITMVSIPNGSFQMGSTVGNANEQPVHTVNINVASLQMSTTEITQAQYESVMGSNPSLNKSGDNYPAENVSWQNAATFCNTLSNSEGLEPVYNLSTGEIDYTKNGYRLPTEAEWEYACRAGTTTKYYTGDSESDLSSAAWYSGNSGMVTHEVKQKAANSFGLYDILGNVREWCNDKYNASYYSTSPSTNPTGPESGSDIVRRCGGYDSGTAGSTVSWREYGQGTGGSIGFRIARGTFSTATATLTAPNGGESWEASTTQNITWSATGVTNVKLEYSTNNGTDWTEISASTAASAGSYTWTVPIRPSVNCKVRVSDASDADITDSSDAAFTITESTGETILYYSNRDGNNEIYVMSRNGSNQTRLTNNAASDMYPTWSPDGSKIAFSTNRDGNEEIYKMDADGSNIIRLTSNSIIDFMPTWSPDGSKIAYVSSDGDYDIWTMNADGSNQAKQTDYSGNEGSPMWSPDGLKILFGSSMDGDNEIYILTLNDSALEKLTDNNSIDGYAQWSPNGLEIAFYSDRDGNSEIYVMNSDGSNQSRKTNNSQSDYDVSWSPDGTKLVFKSIRDGNQEIYSMNADGSNQTNITNNSSTDDAPSWARPVYHEMTSLTITSPNGGENWASLSSQTITWTNSSVTNVKLEYSTDNGTTWVTIVASMAASAGSYTWTTPNIQSSECLVRITDTTDGSVVDQSDAVFTIYQTKPTMVAIPNGTFEMGSASGSANEQPVHTVNINVNDFKMSATEITQAQYEAVIGSDPSNFSGSKTLPVETVSWQDAVTFCNALSTAEGLQPCYSLTTWECDFTKNGYRLPTEAEWEYAARANTTTTYNTGNAESDLANAGWYTGNSSGATHPVGEKETNAFGLYDMHGNVWEWCNDWVDESYYSSSPSSDPTGPISGSNRVKRSGSWDHIASLCRSAHRDWNLPTHTYYYIGFRVARGTLSSVTVTAPNGAEEWASESSQDITWTSSGVPTVKLEYSLDEGTNWEIIEVSYTANLGTYAWAVPDTVSTACLVRVSSASTAAINDVSDAVFEISRPSVTIVAPNGTEEWTAGEERSITWTSDGVEDVLIEYSADNGTLWEEIASSVSASLEAYTWTVPDTSSAEAMVRISDVQDNAITDESDDAFTLLYPRIELTSPLGEESWSVGTEHDIEWTSQDVELVKIEFSADDGVTWLTVLPSIDADIGSYMWLIPDNETEMGVVRISDTTDPELKVVNEISFSIVKPEIIVKSPSGGEEIRIGQNFEIQWSAPNTDTVKIEFSANSGGNWISIASSVSAADSIYIWTVPDIESETCLIRFTDTNNPLLKSESDAVFTIGVPSLSLVSPIGDENLREGMIYNVEWESSIIADLKLELSIDEGENWSSIIDSTKASTGTYEWTVPSTLSDSCLVRATDLIDETITAESDMLFRISEPSITVTAPNGEEVWQVGTNVDITWGSDHVGNVKIEMSIDGGFSWNVLQSSKDASVGFYSVLIPNTPSQYCVIKISDISDDSIEDRSDEPFTIVKDLIVLTAPVGGERWKIGTDQDIQWDAASNITSVDISYSDDGGVSWMSVVSGYGAALGSYEWTVPETTSRMSLVKITDALDDGLKVQSREPFSIIDPEITVLSPTEEDEWKMNGTYEIAWESVDVLAVKIDYSKNGGATWTAVEDSVDAELGIYEWTLPDTPSSESLIRLIDYDDEEVVAESKVFNIVKPTVTLTSPLGGETWVAGTIQNIRWQSKYVEFVTVSCSTDDGETWEMIAESTPAEEGAYMWMLPEYSVESCLIRIEDAENDTVSDESQKGFTIVSSTGAIIGTVTDSSTGDAIPDVQVALSREFMTITDEDGAYELLGIEPGEYTLKMWKTGYIDVIEDLLSVNAGDALEIDMSMMPKSGPVVTDLTVSPDPTSGSGVITIEGIVQTNMTAKIAPFSKVSTMDYSNDAGVAKAARKKAIEVSNAFLKAQVEEDGSVAIWTKDNKRLVDTNGDVTMIRIDGSSQQFGGSAGSWTTPLYATLNQVRGIWTTGDIEVVYTLGIGMGTTTRRFDSFQLTYDIRNTGGTSHDVGLYRGVDVLVKSKDNAMVNAGGFDRAERSFSGDNVPNYWQAYEDKPDKKGKNIVVQGTMQGWSTVSPDRFAVADWSKLRDVTWDFTVNGNYTDTAVGLWWNPETIASDSNRRISTMYGLGALDTVIGEVSMSVAADKTLSVRNNLVTPNPMQVTALVTNRRGISITGVELTMELPPGMVLAAGESAVKTIGTLSNGETKQAVWRIVVEPYGEIQTYAYSIRCSSESGQLATTTIRNSVMVPAVMTGLYVRGAELYFDDDDPGENNGVAMRATDELFNEPMEGIKKTVSISNLTEGQHTVHVRGRDSEGDWGDVTVYEFTVNEPAETIISVYPEAENKAYGGRILRIPVMLDMGESEDKAGSFQAFVTWPTDMFAFVNVSAGTGVGGGVSKGPIVTNTENTDNGELAISYINTKGLDEKSTMFILMFRVIGAGGQQGEVSINMTALSSTTTFRNLLPYTTVENYPFTIIDTSIWGDVDSNESVQTRDAFIIMTYSVGRDVSDYRSYILQRGDVNADGSINSADALICKSYHVNPDNPNLPVRVGQPVGSVPKMASFFPSSGYELVPQVLMTPTGGGDYTVSASIDAVDTGHLIGAADVVISWDPSVYRFTGIDESFEDLVVNTDRAADGEIRISRISIEGESVFTMPSITMRSLGGGGTVAMTVVQATAADSFESLVRDIDVSDGQQETTMRPIPLVLKQNVPNPFNPTTHISYELKESSSVRVDIYNIQGQHIRTVADGFESAGMHTVIWDATDNTGTTVSTGVYIYRVQTPHGRLQKQMLLLR